MQERSKLQCSKRKDIVLTFSDPAGSRGNSSLMGASKDLATETMTGVKNTCAADLAQSNFDTIRIIGHLQILDIVKI